MKCPELQSWDEEAFQTALAEISQYTQQMLDGTLPPSDPELLALANAAIERTRRREEALRFLRED